jgi:phospholipid-binding lipoprotein MlaA
MTTIRAVGALLAVLALAGCATPTPEMIANNDPFEPQNRQMLALNGKIDRYFVIPSVGAYFYIVPEGGRRAIHNLLQNVAAPDVFVNDVLQGETHRAGQTAARFVVNTTVGLGGLFDPATTKFHIPGHGEDFGQTLAVYGVPEGPYLVAPFFGPQPPRDGVGYVVDIFIDPWNQVHFKQHVWWSAGRYYFTLLDLRGQTYSTVQDIQRSSVDYYAALRSLYRQLRNKEIRNGRPDTTNLPDF